MATKPIPELPAEHLPAVPHTVTMENRATLTLTGVQRVISCDETGAQLQTSVGNLSVGGRNIQVSELSTRTGDVRVCGNIEFLQYTENHESTGGLMGRLFH